MIYEFLCLHYLLLLKNINVSLHCLIVLKIAKRFKRLFHIKFQQKKYLAFTTAETITNYHLILIDIIWILLSLSYLIRLSIIIMKLCPTQLAKGPQKKNKSNLNILLFKMFVPFKFPKRYLIYLQCFSEIANISAQKRTQDHLGCGLHSFWSRERKQSFLQNLLVKTTHPFNGRWLMYFLRGWLSEVIWWTLVSK